MPARKRKPQNKAAAATSLTKKQSQAQVPAAASTTSEGKPAPQGQEESKRVVASLGASPSMIGTGAQLGRVVGVGGARDDVDDIELSALSTLQIQAMLDRTAEYAESNHFSSVGDLNSLMQNTISQMRGNKTVTETTASVSFDDGGIRRNPARADEDELGLSQLASAVNQISFAAGAQSQHHQHSVLTGRHSNLIWGGDEDSEQVEGAQVLQKTQIYDTSQHAAFRATDIPSHESTFIAPQGSCDQNFGSKKDTSAEQIRLYTPLLLQQLMLNSEKMLLPGAGGNTVRASASNQLGQGVSLGGGEREFGAESFEFTESMVVGEDECEEEYGIEKVDRAKVDHRLHHEIKCWEQSHFDEPVRGDTGEQPAPVLGLNLREYFQRRHLVDQVPVEPLPPIENPLEMTQNHEDWVRGQEDFKINLEGLQPPANDLGTNLSQSFPDSRITPTNSKYLQQQQQLTGELTGLVDNNAFSITSQADAQKELDLLGEHLRSLSSSASFFDQVRSWEDTLTQQKSRVEKASEGQSNQDYESLIRSSNQMGQQIEESKRVGEVGGKQSMQQLPKRSGKRRKQTKLQANAELQKKTMVFSESAHQVQVQAQKRQQSLDTGEEESKQPSQGKEAIQIARDQTTHRSQQLHSSVGVDDHDSLESFIPQAEIQQLLQLESSLFNLLQETSLCDFMVPQHQSQAYSNNSGDVLDHHRVDVDGFAADESDLESLMEPQAPPQIGGSLKNLEDFLIRGDLRNCVLCNSVYTEGDSVRGIAPNIPRVLYCGDSLCENCLRKHIQRASCASRPSSDKQSSSLLNVAACQLICPVCDLKHVFKLTRTGFLVCNEKYIKVRDEQGPVNFFPPSHINPDTLELLHEQAGGGLPEQLLMDKSISIPHSLIVRSLPVNLELLDLLKTTRKVSNPSQIEFSSLNGAQPQSPINPRGASNEPRRLAGAADFAHQKTTGNGADHREKEAVIQDFVRSYEQQILKKLQSQHDALGQISEVDQQSIGGQSGKVLGLKAQKDLQSTVMTELGAQAISEKSEAQNEADSRDLSSQATVKAIFKSDEQRLVSNPFISQSIDTEAMDTPKPHTPPTTDPAHQAPPSSLFDRFAPKKESLEEEASRRKRKEAVRRKTQLGKTSHLAFKQHSTLASGNQGHSVHSSVGPGGSMSASASSQAMFKLKRRKKLHTLRRDSSCSASSSSSGSSDFFKSLSAQALAQQTFRYQQYQQGKTIARQPVSEQPPHVIPVEVGTAALSGNVQCDRLSDGSDLSPIELVPPRDEKKEESDKTFQPSEPLQPCEPEKAMQPLPAVLEMKRQIRVNRDERRRERKKIVKQAYEEKQLKLKEALDEHQKLEQLQQILAHEQEMEAKREALEAEVGVSDQATTTYDYIVQQIAKEQALGSRYKALAENLTSLTTQPVAAAEAEASEAQLAEAQPTEAQLDVVVKDPIDQGSSDVALLPYTEDESTQKKKARRNKKKRRKQQQMQALQDQQAAAKGTQSGYKVTDGDQTDMYTIMVPAEETEILPDLTSKHGAVRFKYIVSQRDYFDSDQLCEGDTVAKAQADCLTTDGPDLTQESDPEQNRVSMTCGACTDSEYGDLTLWMRCDVKHLESGKSTFEVRQGQAEVGQSYQLNKQQVQLLKELIDIGLPNVPSHYCETCNSTHQHAYKDVSKLCFLCALDHRLAHIDHRLVLLMPPQLLQTQLKRSEQLEVQARQKVAKLQKDTALKTLGCLHGLIQAAIFDIDEIQRRSEANSAASAAAAAVQEATQVNAPSQSTDFATK